MYHQPFGSEDSSPLHPGYAKRLPDVVQFSSPIYYCEEDQGTVLLDVVRLGAATDEATVHFWTRDGSAKAAKKYVATQGLLKFAPGETRKRIQVEILENDDFDASLEFEVALVDARGAQLGLYLHKCRIIIADTDTFPTNRSWQDLHNCELTKMKRWPLMLQYFKMNLLVGSLRRAFLWNVLGDQLMNLRFVWRVVLFNYLIDRVLNPPEPIDTHDAAVSVYAVFGLLLVPHMVMVFNDCAKSDRRIRGLAINQLQANLMRRYLNYDEASRHTVSTSDIVMAITRDVPELVDDAFLSLISLSTQVGRVIILVAFQLYTDANTHVISSGFVLLAFPLVLFCFLRARHTRTEALRSKLFETQTHIVGFVQQSTDCFRLISDYMQRPVVVSNFERRVKAYNNAAKDLQLVEQVNSHFAPFLTTFIIGIVMIVTHHSVLDGKLPLGQFLSGLAVCESIGECYESIYEALLRVQRASAPLLNLVFYMNLPVDVHERMCANHVRMEEELQLERAERNLEECASVYTQDMFTIRGQGLTFSYPEFTGGGTPILAEAQFEFPQGTLVAVTGRRASGKATLLKLLSGVLQPSGVEVGRRSPLFVPPHLRVLHVSHQVLFMKDMDVFENLCFGLSERTADDYERVQEICRRLGISQTVLDMIKPPKEEEKAGSFNPLLTRSTVLGTTLMDAERRRGTPRFVATRHKADLEAHWSAVLSYTDRCLIHIARALVMNPEVLVVHRPLSHFDDAHRKLVMGLLREFVDERGIAQPYEGRMSRRPRTCVFSTASLEYTEFVDMVLHVAEARVDTVDMEAMAALRRCARELFTALDIDNNKRITRAEFCKAVLNTPWVAQLLGFTADDGTASEHAQETLNMIFNLLDSGHSGTVDGQQLVHFLRRRFDDDPSRVVAAIKRHEQATGKVLTPDSPHKPCETQGEASKLRAAPAKSTERLPRSHWAELQVAKEEVYMQMPFQYPSMRSNDR